MRILEQERVRRHTAPRVNARIDEEIAETVQAYGGATEAELSARIAELERGWDVERVLETNASLLALTGVGLAVTRSQRWLALTASVLGFLFLHGTQGWCPPIPLLRRLGVRTRPEMDRERLALKFLRGDFDQVRNQHGEIVPARLVRALERD